MKINKNTTKVAVAIIALLAIVVTIFGVRNSPGANGYTDVDVGDWYYPAVEYMSANGYMTGYSATTFAPGDNLSRAMFVTILYRVSGEKVNANGTKFTDVPQNTWYSEAVSWAVEKGITSGTSATTFSPNDPVTKEQMAVFIKRYADKVYGGFPYMGEPSDINSASSWAKDAVKFAYTLGILYGDNNTKVYPRNNATRTDAVVAFYNFLCVIGKTNRNPILPQFGGVTCNHSWATRHIDEVGHYESSGTHQVMLTTCGCGFVVRSDDPDANTKWLAHRFGDNCQKRFTQGYYEASNGDSKWVVDVSAHDETYCVICGKIQ